MFGVSLSFHGGELAVCGSSKGAKIFNVSTGAELYHHSASDRLRACSLSHDGALMALGGFDARLSVCNQRNGATLL